jgi:hypothetical protein
MGFSSQLGISNFAVAVWGLVGMGAGLFGGPRK